MKGQEWRPGRPHQAKPPAAVIPEVGKFFVKMCYIEPVLRCMHTNQIDVKWKNELGGREVVGQGIVLVHRIQKVGRQSTCPGQCALPPMHWIGIYKFSDVHWNYNLVALPSVGNVGTSTFDRHHSSHLFVRWVSWHHVIIRQLILLTQS